MFDPIISSGTKTACSIVFNNEIYLRISPDLIPKDNQLGIAD